ncbi:MAG: hypothetical protein U0X20_13735 [Caldilineaceae bacterium]
MPIYSRPYNPDGPDFANMWQLVQQDYARRRDSFVWLVSRFGDWKYDCWREAKYFPMFFRRNAQLWLDGFDAVNGFVLSEDGENVFFIFTRQGYDHLLGFIDRLNNISEIERVCTHMDHRRRGYAYAAIRGCFQRLHARADIHGRT